MSRALETPSAETIARLRAVAERRLSAEDFNAMVEAPVASDERRNALELISWFKRRYPTSLERLGYIRRAYARWRRSVR